MLHVRHELRANDKYTRDLNEREDEAWKQTHERWKTLLSQSKQTDDIFDRNTNPQAQICQHLPTKNDKEHTYSSWKNNFHFQELIKKSIPQNGN